MFLDFAACRDLDPALFKLLAAFAHHADPAGECRVLQSEIAAEMGISASTVCRWTAGLMQRGYLSRARIGGGAYCYTIALRCLVGNVSSETINLSMTDNFVPEVQINLSTVDKSNFVMTTKSNSRPKAAGTPEFHPVKVGIAHAASANSGAPASAPARLELSSGSKEPSEREQLSQQDEIPEGWEEAAAAERRLAGLAPVNLACEWRKLVAYSEGARITIWRWRGWVLKARGARTAEIGSGVEPNSPAKNSAIAAPNGSNLEPLPGDERQQRQARDWVRSGFWLRSGMWGPAPDQPGCTLPAALVAWCLRERAEAAA